MSNCLLFTSIYYWAVHLSQLLPISVRDNKASATQTVNLCSILRSSQTKYKINWYLQLPCLTFSVIRDRVKPPSYVVDRWQLDSKIERFLRCLLAKAIRWKISKHNYYYYFYEKNVVIIFYWLNARAVMLSSMERKSEVYISGRSNQIPAMPTASHRCNTSLKELCCRMQQRGYEAYKLVTRFGAIQQV